MNSRIGRLGLVASSQPGFPHETGISSMSAPRNFRALITQIEALEHEARISRAHHKKAVLSAVARAIVDFKVTLPELTSAVTQASRHSRGAAPGFGPRRGTRNPSHPLAGRKIPTKYRDPKSGNAWSGRGSTPRWLRDLEAAGVDRESLRVKSRRG